MKFNSGIFSKIFLFGFLVEHVICQTSFTTYLYPTVSCPTGTYWDISAIQCTSCPTNQVVAANGNILMLLMGYVGLGCVCATGYKKVIVPYTPAPGATPSTDPSGETFTCSSCLSLGMVCFQ